MSATLRSLSFAPTGFIPVERMIVGYERHVWPCVRMNIQFAPTLRLAESPTKTTFHFALTTSNSNPIMKHLKALPLLLVLAGICRASEPNLKLPAADIEPLAKITAPEKSPVGFPVLLQTEGTQGNAMKWIVFPSDPSTVFLAVVTEESQRVGLFVSPKPGTFYFALVAISGDKIAVAKHTLVVEGPQPNPQPDPTPDPVPPVPQGKLWTVIVEESGQLTPAQGKILASKTVAEYLQSKGHHKPWIIDRDVLDENDRQPPSLAEYVARAKSLPYLFLVTETGTVLHESPLPESEAALLEILKKFSGQ